MNIGNIDNRDGPNCQRCGYDSLMRSLSVLSSLAESYLETKRTSTTKQNN